VIKYDSASIQQLDQDNLVIIGSQGFANANDLLGIKFPLIPKFPNTYVIMEKKPLSIPDIAQEYPHFQLETENYYSGFIHSWLGLPLVSKDTLIGMIALDRLQVQPFSAEEIDLAMAFANQAAIAIENARLYGQVQHHVTELESRVKERTMQLERTNYELRAVSRIKDEFVSNVSHELRTPITSLKLRQYLLESHPDQINTHLPVIRRETTRLARIIEDLLTLSGMDQDRTAINITVVDLNSLIQQFVSDRLLLAQERDLKFEANLSAVPPLVEADLGLVEQVLSILLTNAFNYTPSGGQIVVSTERVQIDNEWWAGFNVSDTGKGITKEEQARLFTRFFRGQVGRESGTSGTGLGLALAKEIVQRHHGRIQVESEGIVGRGTTFRVIFPYVKNESGQSN